MSGGLSPRGLLERCDTLLFDMDGTLLDLAFDNYMWLEHIPAAYARHAGVDDAAARRELYRHYEQLKGRLDWYCLDHWSERLGLDVLALHRAEHHRIGWLPGAERFLDSLAGSGRRLLLVTNSHPATFGLKNEATGIGRYFECVYTSHEVGFAKEDRSFWERLDAAEALVRERTLFIDDTEAVLASARRFGLEHLLTVTRPDTTRPAREAGRFGGVEGVADLLPD